MPPACQTSSPTSRTVEPSGGLRSKKKLETWIDLDPSEFCSEEMMRNYQRNKTLIDLEYIPSDLKVQILEDYQNAEHGDRTKLLNYFITKRLKNLMTDIGDF